MHRNTKLYAVAVLALAIGNAPAADMPPAGRALELLRRNAPAARASALDQYVVRDVTVDRDGTEHVRFDRTYAGLPVIGGDLVMHSRRGAFRGVSLTQGGPISMSTLPGFDSRSAVVAAGTEFGSDFDGTPECTLVVYARTGTPQLAWQVRLHNDRADVTYIVAAQGGRVLDRWSNRQTAVANGTARTLYSGDVALTTNSIPGGYEMRDPSRGGTRTIDASNSRTSGQVYKDADNTWGSYAASDPATTAADAQYGAKVTWDYYLSKHGRSGIANDGRGAYSRVHYGLRYSNAFWSDSCFCMTYGDGDGRTFNPFDSLDVAGHEMSHGVTSRTANLTYAGESGGLNEGTSDIFGTMVEFYAGNANDTPDYLIGEKLYKSGTRSLRSMVQPSSDGSSADCWYSSVGSLNVHYSSGVANHFYYLLAEGTTNGSPSKTCAAGNTRVANGTGTVTGIGRAKAERIWYRALTMYMTAGTTYAGARTATLNAAGDLYGTSSAERSAVAAAWSAVGRN